MDTDILLFHSGTIPNSIRSREWRDHLQATQKFLRFPFMPPHWNLPYICSISLIRCIFLSILTKSRLYFVSYWVVDPTSDCVYHSLWIFKFINTPVSVKPGENKSSSFSKFVRAIHLSGSSRCNLLGMWGLIQYCQQFSWRYRNLPTEIFPKKRCDSLILESKIVEMDF